MGVQTYVPGTHETGQGGRRAPRRLLPAALLGVLLASLFAFGALAVAGAVETRGTDQTVGLITEYEARRFADGFFDRAREEYPHVGASIAIVHDGALIYAGGYGRYGIDDDRVVDASRTLFGAGSIGKLVTWTAVMQLVERGLLDLDTDVNEYLTTFSVPATFDEPITLRHLMTHTPGFDDTAIGSITQHLSSLTGLESYLAGHMPTRLRPPGRVTQYSNYGAALAGYIVSQASGIDFNAYVEHEIFAPIGMERSSFRQPLPDKLAAAATPGHVLTPAGQIAAVPHVFGEIYPAGTGYFTATDLARFMIAHLGTEAPILRTETAQTMHARAFGNDPRLPGMALGFIEGEANGLRTLWHTGTSPAGSHGILGAGAPHRDGNRDAFEHGKHRAEPGAGWRVLRRVPSAAGDGGGGVRVDRVRADVDRDRRSPEHSRTVPAELVRPPRHRKDRRDQTGVTHQGDRRRCDPRAVRRRGITRLRRDRTGPLP